MVHKHFSIGAPFLKRHSVGTLALWNFLKKVHFTSSSSLQYLSFLLQREDCLVEHLLSSMYIRSGPFWWPWGPWHLAFDKRLLIHLELMCRYCSISLSIGLNTFSLSVIGFSVSGPTRNPDTVWETLIHLISSQTLAVGCNDLKQMYKNRRIELKKIFQIF